MRRIDREISKDFAYMVSDKCEFVTMSMLDPLGKPYCIALTIVRDNDVIYFHSAKSGYKIDCLNHSNEVCLCCVGATNRPLDNFTTEYESAIIRGNAIEITNTDEQIYALRLLCLRHTPTNMMQFDNAINSSLSRTSVWKISITDITGKRKKFDKYGKELKFRREEI